MDQETLQLIATFLGRVQLQGNEVPAYNKVIAALEAEHNAAQLSPKVAEEQSEE